MEIRNFLSAVLEDSTNMHDGTGTLKHAGIFGRKDFRTPVNFLNYTILPPGTSIGLHTHGNDEELYIVLEGEGRMHTDGQESKVVKGDIIKNKPFGTHALYNDSEKDIKILVIGIGTVES